MMNGRRTFTGGTNRGTPTIKDRNKPGINVTDQLDRVQTFGKVLIQNINVYSLKKRLEMPDFIDSLRNCDISFLCETKLDDADVEYIQEIMSSFNLCAFFK